MRITLFTLFISTLFQAVLSNPSDTSLAVLSRQVDLELGSAFYHRSGWDTVEYNGHFLDNFTHLTPRRRNGLGQRRFVAKSRPDQLCRRRSMGWLCPSEWTKSQGTPPGMASLF